MKAVVIGGTGNCGSALVRELSAAGHEVVGVARRAPRTPNSAESSVSWRSLDVARDEIGPALDGADVVYHLAWMFQPTHQPEVTWRTNVVGTQRVLEAAADRKVPVVVVASSVAAYSPGTGDAPVDESWPTDGPSSAAYAREKAYVERVLDAFELAHPDIRTVRIRPGFVFQRSAASEQRRIFLGELVRPVMLDRRLFPVLPVPRGLRFQAVHGDDLARAYVAAGERDVRGAFNIAADDVLGKSELARLMDARAVEVPVRLVRTGLAAAWRLHAVPAPASLLDALMRIPVMSSDRARSELGWQPRHSGQEAVAHMLSGARQGAGSGMPPLHPS